MKNILIRAGMSPLENPSPIEVIERDIIGQNAGNLLYAYSIFRTLCTGPNVTLTPTHYKIFSMSADEINERFDQFIIPMADAFRPSNRYNLARLASLIKSLKIPCVVTGVGLRASLKDNIKDGFVFDKEVKAFISAVLDKSATVGLRGERTGEYLSHLGFKEGSHYTVIGCPSMYMFGRELKIRDTIKDENSFVCCNSSVRAPNHLLKFIEKNRVKFKNHYFIPQRLDELNTAYFGLPYTVAPNKKPYPRTREDSVYKEGRVRFFINVPTWIDFLRQADLSFGVRLHGNIAATVAGCPCIMLVKDSRMAELAELHDITRYYPNEISAKTDIFSLIEKTDFKRVEKKHAANFDNFIDFLDKNGVDHIYKEDRNRKDSPLDDLMAQMELNPPVKPVDACSREELLERVDSYADFITYLQEKKQRSGGMREKLLLWQKENKALPLSTIIKIMNMLRGRK